MTTVAEVLVPEIRDYQAINAEVTRLLDTGITAIRLAGVERQRLLLAGLAGPWNASLLLDGPAGPELAAGLHAAGITIIANSDVDDGAAAHMRSGRLLVLGDADDGLASGLAGGLVIVAGRAGHRAGLRQTGGALAILGPVGRLAGDRRAGGVLRMNPGSAASPPGRTSRKVEFPPASTPWTWNDSGDHPNLDDAKAFKAAFQAHAMTWPSSILGDPIG